MGWGWSATVCGTVPKALSPRLCPQGAVPDMLTHQSPQPRTTLVPGALSGSVGSTARPSVRNTRKGLSPDRDNTVLCTIRMGKRKTKSGRKAILRDLCSMFSLIIVTVVVFVVAVVLLCCVLFIFNGCRFFGSPPTERKVSLCLPPESGWACDCFYESLCDFQRQVTKSHVASAWSLGALALFQK